MAGIRTTGQKALATHLTWMHGAPSNPVYLTAKSLHAGWANSTALRLAGINRRHLTQRDGRLGRNADGSPNGILFESAMDLIADAIPEPTLRRWNRQSCRLNHCCCRWD